MKIYAFVLWLLHSGSMVNFACGQCSGFARSCSSLYSTTTCTDSSVRICPTFLYSCEAFCEDRSDPCRCSIQGLGCRTIGFTSFCDSRVSCSGFTPSCSSLTTRTDCQGVVGCSWTPIPSPTPRPTPTPTKIPTPGPTQPPTMSPTPEPTLASNPALTSGPQSPATPTATQAPVASSTAGHNSVISGWINSTVYAVLIILFTY